jgi:predicted enzyme related to lactoylglutathione lyase
MANNIPLIVFPVKNLENAKKFYNAFLGTEPYVDGAWYVGYKLDDLEVGLDPNGKSVVSYIDVVDIAASLATYKEAGAEVVMEPKDVGGGLLVAQVMIEGNVMGLRQKAE